MSTEETFETQSHKFNTEVTQQLSAWMQKIAGGPNEPSCQVCADVKWTWQTESIETVGTTRLIQRLCGTCGNIMFFDADRIGLPKEPARAAAV